MMHLYFKSYLQNDMVLDAGKEPGAVIKTKI